MDYRACRWPGNFSPDDVAAYFTKLNRPGPVEQGATLITFSHFLPRIDLLPQNIPEIRKVLYPVLGSTRLEQQVRALRPKIHVYGHSHVHRQLQIDGITYVNNAVGYPQETWSGARRLLCIHST